jgi:hypothetical protein
VGVKIGRDLRFAVAPNPEFVGITSQNIFVLGPGRLSEMAAHDYEDGDPRLI